MFTCKLADLINDAVYDCMTFGRGKARYIKDGVTIDIEAEWAENERDINITIFEDCAIRFEFTESIPEQLR